jgi:hypothetical protein
MFVPLLSWPANPERITQKSDNHTKRKQKNCVDQSEQNACLKIADLPADTFPPFPNPAQQTSLWQESPRIVCR